MKKANKWTPLETEMLQTMIDKHEGSPSGAYAEHPDWKAKLESKHSTGAIYAKIHNMKGGTKKSRVVSTTVPAAQQSPRANRLLVVNDGEVQLIQCPSCRHEFKVFQAPA